MPTIQALCHRVILLKNGQIVAMGDPGSVVESYMKSTQVPDLSACVELTHHPNRVTQPEQAMFRKLRLLDAAGKPTSVFQMGEPITFEIELDTRGRALQNPLVFIGVDRQNLRICNLTTAFMVKESIELRGQVTARCLWHPDWLAPGNYDLALLAIKPYNNDDRLDQIQPVAQFVIVERDIYGTGPQKHTSGLLVPNGRWEFEAHPEPLGALA
jgi:hypothetical protein